jgi:hypothetical protein
LFEAIGVLTVAPHNYLAALTLLPFLFMLFFLITIRAIQNKDKSDLLIFITSVLFGAFLFISVVILAELLKIARENRIRFFNGYVS